MTKEEKEIHKIAKQRLLECIDREHSERALQLDDLKFSTLDQWPESVRNERENDPNGPRPCLTIDKMNQYIVQVVNDMRKNKPGVKVRGVDSGSDPEVADIYMGIIRHIEDISNADIAYSTAGESQVRVGEGYFRIVTDYPDQMSSSQEIYIKPIMDRFSVYLGPHIMPDGSDAEYGFVFEDVQKEKFKRDWPKANDKNTELDSDGSGHFCDENAIRIAEYFYIDYEPQEIVFLEDGRAMVLEEFNKEPVFTGSPQITKQRTTQKETVKWVKMTGAEILESEDWAGKYIPIVKVTGKEAIVEGEKRTWGLVRPAKDSLRMYNFWASAITEKIALSPKAPFIGAVGQFETKGDDWANANRSNLSRLEYDAIDVNGVQVPAPHRQAPAPLETAMMQQMQLIEHDIQTSLGMFKASVGESDPQQSGRAILALQRESDTGTSHFPDNLSVAIRYGGRILIDLIPKIYDVGMIKRIIGEDGESSQVEINPNQQEAVRQVQTMDGRIKAIYNLGVGTYDLSVTVGPSYNTKRMEMAEMLVKMNEGDPTFKQVAGDLLFDSMDWPDGLGQKLGARYKKMLPPALQEGGPAPLPPEVQQKMQDMEQQLQQMGQENQQLKSGAQEAQMKVQAGMQETQMKLAAKKEELNFEQQMKIEFAQQNISLEKEKAIAQHQLKIEIANQDAELAKYEAELKARTAIEVAEINKGATLQAAQIKSASDAMQSENSANVSTHL